MHLVQGFVGQARVAWEELRTSPVDNVPHAPAPSGQLQHGAAMHQSSPPHVPSVRMSLDASPASTSLQHQAAQQQQQPHFQVHSGMVTSPDKDPSTAFWQQQQQQLPSLQQQSDIYQQPQAPPPPSSLAPDENAGAALEHCQASITQLRMANDELQRRVHTLQVA